MVHILSVATLAVAFFSTTDVLAHPAHDQRAAKHHAIALQDSFIERGGMKAVEDVKRAQTTTTKTTTTKKSSTTTSKPKTTTTTKKTTTTTRQSSTTTTTKPKRSTTTTKKTTTTTTTTSNAKTSTTTTTTTTKKTATTTTTTTQTSSPNAASQAQSGTITDVSLLRVLPPSGIRAGWTFAGQGSTNVASYTLTNSALVLKGNMALPHEVVSIDGTNAIHGHVAQGSVALAGTIKGGFSFYTPGPPGSTVDVTKARTVSLGYRTKFSNGYAWNMGGKLPGLYGGVSDSTAQTCSGGRHDDGCFSTRFMWRANGAGELYLYVPPDFNRANLCGNDGYGVCHYSSDDGLAYGASVGTGLYSYVAGGWTYVRQVVHLNTPGLTDGWIQVYVNGASSPSISVTGLSFRTSSTSVFRGMQTQYFHGGHNGTWAAPQDQDAWFADFSLAILDYDS